MQTDKKSQLTPTKFVFHGHDNFDMIQRIQTKIVDKMWFNCKLKIEANNN